MKDRIHRQALPDGDFAHSRPLSDLATRSPDDPSIALMDAWAVVGDVLTFYQERIANEGYLRTATERRSVLELARAIGYELNPGVSASAYLAFKMDDADGAPNTASIPSGTQVQSIPVKQDEVPQTFETQSDFVADVARNAMRPQLEQIQAVASSSTHVYLKGLGLGIRTGDVVLLLVGESTSVKRVVGVDEDTTESRTRIDFEPTLETSPATTTVYIIGELDPNMDPLELTRSNVESWIFNRSWTEADLQAFLTLMDWAEEDVLPFITDLRKESLSDPDLAFLRFKTRASVFGHSAPDWRSMAKSFKAEYLGIAESDLPADDPGNWPDFTIFSPSSSNQIDLDRVYQGILAGSWAVLSRPDGRQAFEISDLVEAARAEYTLSGQTTRLTLSGSGLSDFEDYVRETTVHAESENLPLAATPISGILAAETDTVVLQSMVLGLKPGQPIVLSGEEIGKDDFEQKELLFLDEIDHRGGRTTLKFVDPIEHDYDLESVEFNANVVLATHGETVSSEVLGAGDGSATNQRFVLKKSPVTHTSSSNASGSESSLAVRVNDVLWEKVDSMYGLADDVKAYIERIDNDGNTSVVFGDGKSGARLPTGQENVKATYRAGIGSVGEVGAGSLSLLKRRPPGIRSVDNPFAASGAEDPEDLDGARDNAPLTVRTLDRIVSLQDYEDFARSFAGIGKAKVASIWDGESEIIHLTVADADGDEVVSPLYDNLLAAIEAARDPYQPVLLETFESLRFFVSAKILIDSDYLWEKIKSQTEGALIDKFRFESRSIAQPVSAAEVIEVMHSVEGVVAVDLDELYMSPPGSTTPPSSLFQAVLDAPPALFNDVTKQIDRAHLLLIHEQGIELTQLNP
jgi:hypothetical protein